jgi:hypothetical protein
VGGTVVVEAALRESDSDEDDSDEGEDTFEQRPPLILESETSLNRNAKNHLNVSEQTPSTRLYASGSHIYGRTGGNANGALRDEPAIVDGAVSEVEASSRVMSGSSRVTTSDDATPSAGVQETDPRTNISEAPRVSEKERPSTNPSVSVSTKGAQKAAIARRASVSYGNGPVGPPIGAAVRGTTRMTVDELLGSGEDEVYKDLVRARGVIPQPPPIS